MTPIETKKYHDWPGGEIGAYIDGELSPADETELEKHFAVCGVCCAELNQQKNFLFVLNASLETETELELPKNFTKTIVAHAESRVSGLRGSKERFTAVFICSALFLFALFALGSDAERGFQAFGNVGEKILAVGYFTLHIVYNISLGIAVIVRSLFYQTVFNSARTLFFLVILFTAALYAFSPFVVRDSRIREN